MAEDLKRAIDIDTLSHFKAKQDLANEQKFKRKDDAADLKGAVRYDAAQALTEQEKAQARLNIGAAAPGEGGGGGGSVEGAVRYDVEQALDDEAKARARANLGTTDGTWENMPDKPFGEVDWSIEWDGTPTNDFVEINKGIGFYKVSEATPTKTELVGATYKGVDGEGTPIEGTLSSSDIVDCSEHSYGYADDGGSCFFVITTQATEALIGDFTISFPSSGTWFLGMGEEISLSNKEIKKIDSKYLPSYVDDVVEGYYKGEDGLLYSDAEFTTAITGESGKIYIDLNTSNTYRWGGSVYVRLNPDEITFATDADIDALFT